MYEADKFLYAYINELFHLENCSDMNENQVHQEERRHAPSKFPLQQI